MKLQGFLQIKNVYFVSLRHNKQGREGYWNHSFFYASTEIFHFITSPNFGMFELFFLITYMYDECPQGKNLLNDVHYVPTLFS
jgi:hypothetical protein